MLIKPKLPLAFIPDILNVKAKYNNPFVAYRHGDYYLISNDDALILTDKERTMFKLHVTFNMWCIRSNHYFADKLLHSLCNRGLRVAYIDKLN